TDNGAGRNDLLPNAFDDSGYYGLSDLDRPHVLVSQVRYTFPALESSPQAMKQVLGGWNVAGIFQAQSGSPFDVRTPVDIAGVGPGSGQQFYNTVGDPNALQVDWSDATNRATWFDKSAFAAPAAGTYATSFAKDFLRNPGFWELNMSLRKSFAMSRSQHLDVRLEAFNVLNRTRLGNAVSNPTLADFGFITSRLGNRTMQVGIQYVF